MIRRWCSDRRSFAAVANVAAEADVDEEEEDVFFLFLLFGEVSQKLNSSINLCNIGGLVLAMIFVRSKSLPIDGGVVPPKLI